MKYIIDEKVCEKHNLTITEVLCLLFLKSCDGNYSDVVSKLIKEEKIIESNTLDSNNIDYLYLTPHWDAEVSSIILESDNSVPDKDRIENLVNKMRELFPKGMKIGNSAWRGNVRELKLRMQKFFKMYGDYSDEAILKATKAYVDSFNGNYTYMRILKYFILKSEIKQHQNDLGEVISQVEDVSELANMLDNPEEALVKRTRLI